MKLGLHGARDATLEPLSETCFCFDRIFFRGHMSSAAPMDQLGKVCSMVYVRFRRLNVLLFSRLLRGSMKSPSRPLIRWK